MYVLSLIKIYALKDENVKQSIRIYCYLNLFFYIIKSIILYFINSTVDYKVDRILLVA